MRKSFLPFLVVALLVSMFMTRGQTASAQSISLPAEINKSFSPISIPSGGTSLLRVTVFNPNPFALTNASWTDTMPSGIRVVGVTGNTCGGTVAAAAGSNVISLSGGTVPAQSGSTAGRCTVSVNVTSTTPGSLINTIPVGALSSTGGGTTITNTSPASATLNVTGTTAPTVTKSFSPSTIWAGGVSQLSITISNNANTPLTQASLRDDLPANVFLANPVSPTLTGCGSAASVAATSGGTSVTLNNGSIAPASTCTITVNVTGNVQGSYTNRIPAGRLQTQQGLTNPTDATAPLRVQEIGATKRFVPSTFSAGGTTTLNITLQNPTASPYTNVSVTDNLPSPPLTVVNVVSNSCGGSTSATTTTSIILTGGTIPAGTPTTPGSCTISVLISAPAGTATQTLTNSIPTTGLTTAEGVGLLRPANANVTVSGTGMSGVKSFSPSSIPAGGNSRLRIDFTAPSDTNLTSFSFTDPLPTGITVSNSTAPAITGCGATPPMVLTAPTGATTISLTGGLILAGQRCRIDVYVTSNTPTPPGAPYTNTILPTNITNNENRTPTSALTANLGVTGNGSLSISLVKGFDPLIVTGGAASTMSIELINPGTVTLTGISFTDTMPANMILANPVNPNVGTCGGTLTGTPGSNSFTFSGGTLPPLSSCTLTLSATITVNGNLTNTIPAGAVTTAQGVTNADPVEASLTNLPGASVSKAFSPNPIPTGSYSLLTITIQNTGNIGLTGMGMSDSLPSGLQIASGTAPAPVNNCGGTLTAVPGTQLIELVNGALGANATCTIVVAITGSSPGDFQNTIPAGGLRADPNTQNIEPATATLTITGEPVAGGGGGGGNRTTRRRTVTATSTFLIPVTAGFAPGMPTKLDSTYRPSYDATGLRIEIPVLKVTTPIVGVESKKSGWDISWLQDEVGWLNGTAFPTWKGNSVLTAHVVNADGKPGLFYNLKALGLGEYVYVYNAGYRYTYQVVSNTFVKQDDSSLMTHEDKPYLTLFTCDTYDAATGKYLRYVEVRAVLVDVREIK